MNVHITRLRAPHDILNPGTRKSPPLSIIVIVTMALAIAIGANIAVYSILADVVLKALPYAHQDRLVRAQQRRAVATPATIIVIAPATAVRSERHDTFSDPGYWGSL